MVKLTDKQLLVVAGAGVLLAWYVSTRLAHAVAEVAPLVNPFDERNLASQAANDLYQAITGDRNGSIGTGIYDATHGGALDPTSDNNAAYEMANWSWRKLGVLGAGETIGTKAYDVTHDGSLNPTSTNNVIYRQVGGDDWSIGTKIYDWLH